MSSVLAEGSVDEVGLGAVSEAAVLVNSGASASSRSSIMAREKQFTPYRWLQREIAGSVDDGSDAESGLKYTGCCVSEVAGALKEAEKAMLRSCVDVQDCLLVDRCTTANEVEDR